HDTPNPTHRTYTLKCEEPDKSACLFYVSVTRARHSVAIIISDSIRKKTHLDNLYIPITIWNPENA
ncbi:hypothetical protein, partial [Actinomyces bouchesdurhonensis]|uniref:hypothetical protein n=1 Tax=Actinomyces bouchesdurhonensis TaxID=1852361 RepID=UPI0028EA344F